MKARLRLRWTSRGWFKLRGYDVEARASVWAGPFVSYAAALRGYVVAA